MNPKELSELAMLHGAMQKPEELELLCQFLEGKNAESILEIGTGRGGTLWLWHHLAGNKTVISIDLWGGDFGGGPSPEDMERIENWLDKRQNTFIGNRDSHKEETVAEVKEALQSVGAEKLDILYIDGDHAYEGVKKDFEMYSPVVTPGGFIIFHDILEHPPELNCHVKEFWDEIKSNYQHQEFCVTNSGGMLKTMPQYKVQETTLAWGGIGVLIWPS